MAIVAVADGDSGYAGVQYGDTSEFSNVARIEDTPPRVVGVTVAKGDFSFAFAPVADGDDQLHTIPNGGINKVSITFTRSDVDTDKYALTLVRNDQQMTVAADDLDIAWSQDGYTATWTLDSTIYQGEWYITLDAAEVTTPEATQFDGEWVNPDYFTDEDGNDTFPSGNSSAGGDFEFAITLSVGDASLDGLVNQVDSAILASHWLQSGGWEDGDFNGDDFVDDLDLAILAANYGGPGFWQPPDDMLLAGGDDPSLSSLPIRAALLDALLAKYDLAPSRPSPDGTLWNGLLDMMLGAQP